MEEHVQLDLNQVKQGVAYWRGTLRLTLFESNRVLPSGRGDAS